MKNLILCLALCGLMGCVSTNALLLGGTGTYPAVDPGEVRIYLTEKGVNSDFERIALITAKANFNTVDEIELLEELRKRAAKIGADAIILMETRNPPAWREVAEDVLGVPAPDRTAKALAIKLAVGKESL